MHVTFHDVDPDQTVHSGAILSGSTLFAQTCLSKNLGSLQYTYGAPDNIRTAINYGSGSSKYGPIVKTASTEYGRFLIATVWLFQ